MTDNKTWPILRDFYHAPCGEGGYIFEYEDGSTLAYMCYCGCYGCCTIDCDFEEEDCPFSDCEAFERWVEENMPEVLKEALENSYN